MDHEADEIPGVVVHDESASVADHLGDAAEYHEGAKDPLAMPDPLYGMDGETQSKQRNEGAVRRQRRPVLEDTLLGAAGLDGAVAPACGGLVHTHVDSTCLQDRRVGATIGWKQAMDRVSDPRKKG